jgi:hypothetical protein
LALILVGVVGGILKFSDGTELCIAFVNKTGISVGGDDELIAATHNSAEVWVSHSEYTISK